MPNKTFSLTIGDITASIHPTASEKPGVTYKVSLTRPSGKYITTSLEAEHIARGIQAPLKGASLAYCVHEGGGGRPQEVIGWELTIAHNMQLSLAEKAYILGFLLQNCSLKNKQTKTAGCTSAGTAI